MSSFLESLLTVGEDAAKWTSKAATDVGASITEAVVGEKQPMIKNPQTMAYEQPPNKGGFVQFIKEDSPIKKALIETILKSSKPAPYIRPSYKGKSFTKFGYQSGPALHEGEPISSKGAELFQELMADAKKNESMRIAEQTYLRKQKEKEEAAKYVAPMSYKDILKNYPYVSEDPYSPYYTPPSIDELDRDEEEYWQQIPPWSDIMNLSRG